MKNYKFAHIFTVDSSMYNKSIQKLICETLDSSKHLFVYMHEYSFLFVKNEELGTSVLNKSPCDVNYIKKILKIADFVIIHNMAFSNREISKLSDDEAGRCVWCVWGPDLYKNSNLLGKSSGYNFLRTIYHLFCYQNISTANIERENALLADTKISKFKAICAGFEGDIKEIKNRFPSISVYQALYPASFFFDDINGWLKNVNKYDENTNRVKILLGHSAFEFLQHKKWLNRLYKIRDKVELFIPLNYGSEKYADKIEQLAKKKFGENAIVFRERMNPEEYFCKILSQVDIAIFDFNIQSAYGNAILLLFLGKKIYYPENSVMYKGLKKNGVNVFKIEDINVKNINSLKENKLNLNDVRFAEKRLKRELFVEQWKMVFDSIEIEKS